MCPGRVFLSFVTYLLFLHLVIPSNSYRLNVPRVLLPYHPTIPVKFVLEVSQPSGGCFNWRSTRPDVVSVQSIEGISGDCSDRAEIRATTKAASGELTAVIFAEDSASGTMLSCGVSVDQIARIRVETTTKILFVDAAPARMVVEAFNAEGDTFSTLSEIPIEWELVHSGGNRPLRIAPFEQSTYEAPAEIVALEKQKKKGYVILVEGVVTGSAILTAKFSEPYLAKIAPHSLDLTVVANLLLIPAYDLFVPLYSVVPFKVLIVKQHSTEVVPMPSSSYYLQLDSKSVCSLEKETSSIRAMAKGRTNIHLYSHNVDVKAKTGVRPPSTAIHVVDPETLQWTVSGSNWLLQTGTRYNLHVSLLDPHGNSMFLSDNLRFQTVLDLNYFVVHSVSENQTYYEVTPMKIGKSILKSTFISVIDETGREHRMGGKVTGEQTAQIVDPIRIHPSSVIFPYLPKIRSSFVLKTTGGSGLYDWTVDDSSVCNIDPTSGLLSSGTIGVSKVIAVDRRNTAHRDTAQVSVLDIISLSFGETIKEAVVGSLLVLNVQLLGAGPNGSVPFTDCRAVEINVFAEDATIFEHVSNAPISLPTVGTGCSTVTLKALASGDTRITLSFDKFKASIDVSAYPPLTVAMDQFALAIGSHIGIQFEGGPRPWLLDPSNHFRKAFSDNMTSIKILGETVDITCGNKNGTTAVHLHVGNSPSLSLPIPLVTEVVMEACCTHPSRLAISTETNINLAKCTSNTRIILADSFCRLLVRGHGSCGTSGDKVLNSISGLKVKWSSNNEDLLKIDVSDKERDSRTARVLGQGKPGMATISAEVFPIHGSTDNSSFLKSTIDLRVVYPPSVHPKKLVLWNEKVAHGSVQVRGGSGHFYVVDHPGAPFTATVKESTVTVVPRNEGVGSLRVVDACVENEDDHMDISVKITDIHSLIIRGPQFMEVGSEIIVSIDAVDESGSSFSHEHGNLGDAVLEANEENVHIKKMDGTRYLIRALSTGVVSLTASARSSGDFLTSRLHSIQVFSPISLHPKIITLIPESVFQLEIIGGPQPTPPVEFLLNNTKVAVVESSALIKSLNLGYTSITGSVSVGEGHVTKDMVVLRVVSLSGIRIVASSKIVDRGGRLWLRVEGIVDGETPFVFGGALYPFKITWIVSHPEVLRSIHPMGASVSETDFNHFTAWLDASSAGSAVVKVRVELSDYSKQHFVGSMRSFEDSIEVHVEEPLGLQNPSLLIETVRIAPVTQLQLWTASPPSSVEFSVLPEFSGRLSISKSGLLQTYSRHGPAAVVVRRIDSADNDTLLIPVVVSPISSLDVSLANVLESSTNSALLHLPVGATVDLVVSFRDSRGRLINKANNKIHYRPHRFDLTQITASNTNRTLTITLKTAGETVLHILDSADPSLSVFVRISASESLIQLSHPPLVSDIICFSSPLAGQSQWFASDNNIHWINPEKGVALLTHQGTTHVTVKVGEQSMHTKIMIEPVRYLSFTDSIPNPLSNIDGVRFIFPIKISSNSSINHRDSVSGCSTTDLDFPTSVPIPFDCFISFGNNKLGPAINLLTVRAVYEASIGSYACKVERQAAGNIRMHIIKATETVLSITAKWRTDSQIHEASVQTAFHMAMDVVESEILLSNLDRTSTILSVHVPSYLTSHIVATGCEGDVVTVTGTQKSDNSGANVFFLVKLNIKSAAMWSELWDRCAVTVENRLTGQKINVPVRVKLVGEAAKHVYNALDSSGFIDFVLIFLQHYSSVIPSLMWACVAGILFIGAYWFLRRRIWEKEGVFTDESTIHSMVSSPSLNRSHLSMQSSPSFFRDSPVFKSTPVDRSTVANSRPIGSRGEPVLWSTDITRRT